MINLCVCVFDRGEGAVEGVKKKVARNQQDLEKISKKVQSIFFKIQCDQMDSAKQGGGNQTKSTGGNKVKSMNRSEDSKASLLAGQTVSESNVIDFMGVIEQRAVSIINTWNRTCNANGAFSVGNKSQDNSLSGGRSTGGEKGNLFTQTSSTFGEWGDKKPRLQEIGDEILGEDVGEEKVIDLETFKKSLLNY